MLGGRLAGRANAADCGRRSSRAPDLPWIAQIGAIRSAGESSRRRSRNICARPTPSRKTPPNCRADDQLRRPRLFGRGEPTLSEASARDAAAFAALHAAAFRRGWSEDEFERLLVQRNVIAHRAMAARGLAGLVLSRLAGGEAEIRRSPSRAPAGRGLGRRLLDLHLRRLAGLGVLALFLEVDEDNTPALRLYARAGFREVAAVRPTTRERHASLGRPGPAA